MQVGAIGCKLLKSSCLRGISGAGKDGVIGVAGCDFDELVSDTATRSGDEPSLSRHDKSVGIGYVPMCDAFLGRKDEVRVTRDVMAYGRTEFYKHLCFKDPNAINTVDEDSGGHLCKLIKPRPGLGHHGIEREVREVALESDFAVSEIGSSSGTLLSSLSDIPTSESLC